MSLGETRQFRLVGLFQGTLESEACLLGFGALGTASAAALAWLALVTCFWASGRRPTDGPSRPWLTMRARRRPPPGRPGASTASSTRTTSLFTALWWAERNSFSRSRATARLASASAGVVGAASLVASALRAF